MNSQLFKAYLVQNGKTQGALAKELGLSLSRINAKINGSNGADFTQTEISEISRLWHLSAEELKRIFF